jgi:indole-3-glycerol phosphate synthase
VAEIKHGSPSAGTFSSQLTVMERVTAYEKAGADAISYVSDTKYFGGSLEELKRITSIAKLPVLQKDFIISMYQLVEAAITQVDAILLIARIVDEKALKSFVNFAQINGIEPVVEVYNEVDLDKALKTDARIIGVNARDLDTFETDINKAAKLIRQIPSHISVIGFSGVETRKDIETYKDAGAKAVLVGSTLMKAKDILGTIKELKQI